MQTPKKIPTLPSSAQSLRKKMTQIKAYEVLAFELPIGGKRPKTRNHASLYSQSRLSSSHSKKRRAKLSSKKVEPLHSDGDQISNAESEAENAYCCTNVALP